MSRPEWWPSVSPYLDQALEMSEPERAAWIESLRAREPEAASRLETLLREHRDLAEHRFLEAPPLRPLERRAAAGQAFGAYTIVAPLGEGGMGSVWLAERSDGRFERRVAVKLLRAALGGRGREERFKREGAILGRLAHPHIAELLDAGVTDDGQPYLILEHVEGEAIDRYADARRLDVDARLRLFLDVLAAVAHAHVNLIVHRDLKPSNVLVRNDGQVKLLDFGIAKLLEDEGESGAATQLTREAGGALTPEYAAPEQLASGPVTTSTDVYSLGVLLYVLLTGQHPLGPGPHSTADLVKSIVETEPPRASDTVVSGKFGADVLRANAAGRSSTPEKLRRRLRGDLDTIVAKALKKHPRERYSSVAEMAEDLRRSLALEPISARPDTLAYVAARFVRRNRLAVALATLALVGSAAGAISTWVQARTARAQRDFAIRQLARAEALNDLNSFVLSDAAPSGKPFTVKDLLARSEHIVEQQKGKDDTARVELLISIGEQYSTLNDSAASRRLLNQAYDLSRQLSDPSVSARAACTLASILPFSDKPRAEALLREGLRELPDKPEYALDRVSCLLSGSNIAANQGFYEEAIARAQDAQHLLEQAPVKEDSLELNVFINLINAYRIAGRPQEAIPAFEQSSARLASLGRDDSQTGGALQEMWAIALDDLGRQREADTHYRRAIEICQADASGRLVPTQYLVNYARNLQELGRLDEAAKVAERAYEKGQQAQEDLITTQALFVQSRIYREQGNLARAEKVLAEAEPVLRQDLPPEHYAFASLALERALLRQARGDLPEALDFINQGVGILQNAARSGRQGYFPIYPLLLVARSQVELSPHRSEEAAADARRAVELFQQTRQPGTFSSHLGRAYLALGRALEAQGQNLEARAAFLAASQNLENTLGPDYPDSRAARRLANAPTPPG